MTRPAPTVSREPEAQPQPMQAKPGRPRIRVRRVANIPMLSMRVLLPGGGRHETIPGQAYVTGRMLSEGSRTRSWRQIAEDLEDRGMLLSSGASFETLGLGIEALAGDWERALEWAAELSLSPAFPEDRCTWVRRQAIAELESMGDQPEIRTAWAFMEQLYSPHPRGRRLQGNPESLLALTPADCAAFHLSSLSRPVVAVCGDIDPERVRERIEELFASLLPAEDPQPGPAPAAPPEPSGGDAERRVSLRGSEQAHLYLGHRTLTRRHPDLAALEVAGVILGAGSGLTGRIPQRIREREGLAYSTHVQTVAGASLDPGRLVAYVGTSPDTVEQARRGVIEELERFCGDGIEEAELEQARSYLLGREPFRRETARQWAELLVAAELYGLPVDDPGWRERQLRALDRPAVEAAIRRHLKPAELQVTVGLPAGNASPTTSPSA